MSKCKTAKKLWRTWGAFKNLLALPTDLEKTMMGALPDDHLGSGTAFFDSMQQELVTIKTAVANNAVVQAIFRELASGQERAELLAEAHNKVEELQVVLPAKLGSILLAAMQ